MKPASQSFTLVCAAIAMVLGFIAGAGAFSGAASKTVSRAGMAGGAGHSTIEPAADDARFASDDAAIGAVFSAWQRKNPLLRAAELKAALEGLDAGQLAQMVERVAGFGDWEMQELLAALVKQWTLMDPAAAAAWARPAIERFYAGGMKNTDRAIVSAWSAADPERAIALALERPDAMASQRLIGDAIRALAENDPGGQLDRMAALPDGRLRDAAIATALAEWAKADPSAALARLDSLSSGARRDSTLTTILAEWAKKDPAAALAEMSARIDAGEIGRGRGDLARMIGAAAAEDPAAALKWAEGLPADLRDGATVLAAAGWARKDPIAALEWARSNGMQLDRSSFLSGNRWENYSVLDAALNSDAKKTVDWLRTLPASAERDRFLTRRIYRLDMDTARDLFAEMSPEAQKLAAGSLGYRLGEMGQDEAIAWTKEQVSGPARETMIASLVSDLGRSSPEQLEALVAKYPSGADRDAALRGAADWLYQDATAARAWLAGTSELAPGIKAMLLRQSEEN